MSGAELMHKKLSNQREKSNREQNTRMKLRIKNIMKNRETMKTTRTRTPKDDDTTPVSSLLLPLSFLVPLTRNSVPNHTDEKHSHIMMLPPPCFTVGIVCSG
ncbi:hypothetical protein CHARACLAT_030570 [Characodon lateralis]|uniref:Uncharacterized protein n=1 Tax=Characodon lateralis TaxID=208331 RepID=A0ABU7DLB4_9TELE|nr:hypothetical protein [Characodon lateralis]